MDLGGREVPMADGIAYTTINKIYSIGKVTIKLPDTLSASVTFEFMADTDQGVQWIEHGCFPQLEDGTCKKLMSVEGNKIVVKLTSGVIIDVRSTGGSAYM